MSFCVRDYPPILTQLKEQLERQHPIVWEEIQDLQSSDLIALDSLSSVNDLAEKRDLASRLAILKLNGGLGTSMGCLGPKSVIEVREGLSFLDLIMKQVAHLNETLQTNIPLILMNSFNTQRDTEEIIAKYSGTVRIICVEQSRLPRLSEETLEPIASLEQVDENNRWYPPGHGDVYRTLQRSGLLDQLRAEGRDLLFMSNVDNLGATVDFRLAQQLVSSNLEFLMEVTPKTLSDVKGGTIIRTARGLQLLELAQVPEEHISDFTSISKFAVFNTNNLWLSLSALEGLTELPLDIIVNKKTVDIEDQSTNVIQLEQAMGSGISLFKRSCGVIVPRSRFLPVKKTTDLLLLRSDFYTLTPSFCLVKDSTIPDTRAVPIIRLSSEFKLVSDFERRIPFPPSLVAADQFIISGDVSLGANIVIKGFGMIVGTPNVAITVPDGVILENSAIIDDEIRPM